MCSVKLVGAFGLGVYKYFLIGCLFACVFVCMCYVRPECAFELGVCKYFLIGCLLEYVFVCVCVYVCARVRRHSSTLAGTRRYSYIHTLVLGALPVHMSERFLPDRKQADFWEGFQTL